MKQNICFFAWCLFGYMVGWWIGGMDRSNSTEARHLNYAVKELQETQHNFDNRLKKLEIPLPIIIE